MFESKDKTLLRVYQSASQFNPLLTDALVKAFDGPNGKLATRLGKIRKQ
jgi:hypothetical protein